MDKHSGMSRLSEVYFALCKSIDTPVSLGAWLRFKHNQLALAEMELNPENYLSTEAFRLDYLVVSFLSKQKGLITGNDLEAEAIRKFTASEHQCKESNERIRKARLGAINPLTSAVISTAKRKISRLLGPFDWSLLDAGFGWGPGATDDIPRRRAFVDLKLCELPISVTRRALPIFRKVLEADLHWSASILGVQVEDLGGPFCFTDDVFLVTEECVIDTVPKNAKTHRVIAKEPRANGFLQKGAGTYLRRRLRRVGIDLNSQVPNQDGAFRAYSDGLATLDLKAASDSMPIELVYELLPLDWAEALNSLRSHKAKMPNGETITLQKFSSMGNGFTFELESLVFWALASSVNELCESSVDRVLVYGDDIIVSAEIADELIDALAFTGFSVNKDKTFVSGNFYESCGKHYFKGKDVTPIYQKETLDEEIEILRCANRLIRYAHRVGHHGQFRKELSGAWHAAYRMAGVTRIFQIPFGTEGDDGWLLPGGYFSTRPQNENFGVRCTVMVFPPRRFPAVESALLAWTLRRGVVTESPYQGFVTSSPDTTMSSPAYRRGARWVMPSGEFGSNW
jgi:hypothetical protein